jgi:YidC/Oxa1 family membrane protein insertase
VFQLIASVLAFFYQIIPNYAIAIALLTLTVMVIVTPLTLKGTKSMLELQKHQPEIKRLQQQYKGDRQKLNEEMMKFYQEHKINPVGGCLPLLLQAPVFFILYRVLHKLTETCTAGDLVPPGAVPKAGQCLKIGNFNPSYLNPSTDLWKALTATDQMMAFGLDLSRSAVDVINNDGILYGLPYLIMVLLVAGSSFYQQRQISSRNTAAVNPQQQMIMKIMPAFFAVIALALPAGMVVYFLTSNLYRVGQQAYITRRFYRKDAEEAAAAAEDSKPAKDGGGATKAKVAPPAPKKPAPGTVTTPPKGKATPTRAPARPTPTRPAPQRPVPKKK